MIFAAWSLLIDPSALPYSFFVVWPPKTRGVPYFFFLLLLLLLLLLLFFFFFFVPLAIFFFPGGGSLLRQPSVDRAGERRGVARLRVPAEHRLRDGRVAREHVERRREPRARQREEVRARGIAGGTTGGTTIDGTTVGGTTVGGTDGGTVEIIIVGTDGGIVQIKIVGITASRRADEREGVLRRDRGARELVEVREHGAREPRAVRAQLGVGVPLAQGRCDLAEGQPRAGYVGHQFFRNFFFFSVGCFPLGCLSHPYFFFILFLDRGKHMRGTCVQTPRGHGCASQLQVFFFNCFFFFFF
jgi:hypothetical protein